MSLSFLTTEMRGMGSIRMESKIYLKCQPFHLEQLHGALLRRILMSSMGWVEKTCAGSEPFASSAQDGKWLHAFQVLVTETVTWGHVWKDWLVCLKRLISDSQACSLQERGVTLFCDLRGPSISYLLFGLWGWDVGCCRLLEDWCFHTSCEHMLQGVLNVILLPVLF